LELGGRPNVGVSKDNHVDVRTGSENVERKLLLGLRGVVQIGGRSSFSREVGRQASDHGHADIGMDPSEQRLGNRMTNKTVEHACRTSGFGESISMGNEAPVTAEFDVATLRIERRVHLVAPEPATPPVVVASDHG
jgi:hypothetical protein